MAICDFRPDATNIPNPCMSKKTNMEGGKKNDLDQKRTTFSNQPDRLSLNRENHRKRHLILYDQINIKYLMYHGYKYFLVDIRVASLQYCYDIDLSIIQKKLCEPKDRKKSKPCCVACVCLCDVCFLSFS